MHDLVEVLASFIMVAFAMLYMIFVFFIWSFFAAVMVGGSIFWVLMIIDVAKRQFPKPDDKTLWVLVVVLAGFIGSLVYYFAVKRPADKKHTHV